ncbi:MAG: hypothetical protein ACI3VB_05960 [Oscillospiraceae bacterium]
MDQRTLAFINLHAVLGGLVRLCELDDEAGKLIEGKDVSVGFSVKNGPEGTLIFKDGKCSFKRGTEGCMVKLPFSSPEKFNGLINGTVTPIPSKGFTKISFLLKEFTQLTDMLTKYLRPEPEALKDERFFNISTTIMFHLILDAVSQVGNEDKVGRASAGYIVDGDVKLGIDGGPVGFIRVKNHRMRAYHQAPENFMSYMEFADMHTARDLFDGNVNAVSCVGQGVVRIGGMISQVDNINRMLDRVAIYLA